MATELTICNSALIKLGASKIDALTDTSKEAQLCKEQYSKVRDDLLLSHPWNFAIKRISLSPNGDTPAYEYEQTFNLPSDYLRIIHMEHPDTEYQVEGNKILANEDTLNFKYIRLVDDASLFTVVFAELLALKLAVELSYSLVQSATLTQTLQAQYNEKLRDARSYDSQEGTPHKITNEEFLNVRF